MQPSPTHSAVVVALLTLVPAFAYASGGSGGSGLESILVLLAVVTVAYLVTHLVSDWFQKRFGFVTGVEYIVLGAVVGPWMGALDPESIGQFIPAIVLGTGSLGLLTGLQLNIRRLTRKRPPALGNAVVVSLGTLAVVAGVPALAAAYFLPETWLHYLPHFVALGAVALVSDQGLVRTLVAFLHARGSGVSFLLRVARLASSFAVLVFGVIFCLERTSVDLFGLSVHGWQAGAVWYLVHLVLGTVLGLIFAAFLLRDFEEEKILTVVIGVVIFTSGFAYYLELSPVVVNFVLGAVLTNVSRKSDQVESMLLSVERPLYIVLFFFAGAQLHFDLPWWAWTLFVPYIGLRSTGRTLGGLVASRATRGGRDYPPMGLSLLAPGGLSIAMALDYLEVYEKDPTGQIVYLTMIMGVIASEVVAYRSTRRWLIDATDVSPEYAELSSAEEASE